MVRTFFSASPVRLGSMKTWLSETHRKKTSSFCANRIVPFLEGRFFFLRTEKWILKNGLFPPKGSRWNTLRCLEKIPQAKHRPKNHPFWGVQNVKTNQGAYGIPPGQKMPRFIPTEIGEKVIRDTFSGDFSSRNSLFWRYSRPAISAKFPWGCHGIRETDELIA